MEHLDPNTERRLLKGRALLDEFEGTEEQRICRAVINLFLSAGGEPNAEDLHRLDFDASLRGLARGVTEFLQAAVHPQAVVDLVLTTDKTRVFPGAPPPPRVH